MNKNEFISSGLLELYALGIASPEEKLQVEEYLQEYPELNQELNEIESSLEDYAQANAIEPSPSVKEKLLTRIATQTPGKEKSIVHSITDSKKIYHIPFSYKLIAAAAVIFLIVSIALNYSYYNKYKNASGELQLAQQNLQQQEKYNQAITSDMKRITAASRPRPPYSLR